MSLLHNACGWLTREGEPVVGITPPSVRMRAGQMTPARRGLVQAAYTQFLQARRLSLSGGGFFVANYRLADGTVVRAISIEGVDHIHVWASDTVTSFGGGVTFWCQPWDDEWVDEQYTEVFTIPRWFEINGGEVEEDSPADFLDDLARNRDYEPPAGTSYPGNQTWFAIPPHPLSGVVVSWWGSQKRYATSERDATIIAGGQWGRAVWPLAETVDFDGTSDSVISGLMTAPTGGIGAAVGEHMFDMMGATAIPPGVTSIGRGSISRNAVWVNGALVATPWTVNSACLNRRGGQTYLRAITITGVTLRVFEMLLDPPGSDWTLAGTVSLAPASIGLGTPIEGGSFVLNYQWFAANLFPTQPFHWNANGEKAVAVIHYYTASVPKPSGGIYPREKYGTHAVLEVEVGSSVSVSLIDQTEEQIEFDSSATSTPPPPPDNPYGISFAGGNSSSDVSSSSDYSAPVAADYRGLTRVVVKTHITSDGQSQSASTASNTPFTGTNNAVVPPAQYQSSYEASRTGSGSATVDYESWMSINGDEISGTRSTRTLTDTSSSYVSNDFDPAFGFIGYDGTNTGNQASSGTFGLWGLCSGDLRGSHILVHCTPITKVPASHPACPDSQSELTATRTQNSSGYPEATDVTLSATVSDASDAAWVRLVDVAAKSSTQIDKLLVPTMRHNVGTVSASSDFGNTPGGSLTINRTGTYGAGPWIGLDNSGPVLPFASQGGGEIAMCPFKLFNGTTIGTRSGVSRISINSSRTPIRRTSIYESGSLDVVGGYGNTALSASALTPDGKTQYMGVVFIAMTDPTTKDNPVCESFEFWFHEGSPFTPDYPDQTDPEAPGGTSVFPHRGERSILLDPIFIGPLP